MEGGHLQFAYITYMAKSEFKSVNMRALVSYIVVKNIKYEDTFSHVYLEYHHVLLFFTKRSHNHHRVRHQPGQRQCYLTY